MDLRAEIAVPRRARRQKQHWILVANRVMVRNFNKQLVCIAELRLELRAPIASYFITAGVDAGADRGKHLLRIGAEVLLHRAHSLFHDALEGASPSRVEGADGFLL